MKPDELVPKPNRANRVGARAGRGAARGRWLVAWLLVWGLWAPAARGQIDEGQFRKDLQSLTAAPNRIIGSDGYAAAGAYLENQIKTLPNVELQTHDFEVMVPVTHSATLTIDGRGIERVYPFWPSRIRLNTTPAEGITGKLVYLGDATFEEIPPATVRGQIAVVEASAKGLWSQAVYFGARAVLVLGTDTTTNDLLQSHELPVPMAIPRFYVPPGKLADDLRAGAVAGEATLKSSGDWTKATARNYYALVMPKNGLPTGWNPDWQKPAALMFSVAYDSSGLVPELAKGAGQAVQAASGLALLRDLSKQPLDRPVVVFFGGADSIQFLATRNMFMALSDPPSKWREALTELAEVETGAREDLAKLEAAGGDAHKFDAKRDNRVLDRVAKIVETDQTLDQDALFRLRMLRDSERSEETKAKRAVLEDRQVALSDLRYMILRRPGDLTGDALAEGRIYLDRAKTRLAGLVASDAARRRELERRVELYEWLATRIGRTTQPDDRNNSSRLIEMMVGLDLSDRGVRVGPVPMGQFQRVSAISNVQNYRDWFTRRARDFREGKSDAVWFGAIDKLLDFEPLSGSQTAQSWLCASLPIPSELAGAWGAPGLSMVTLDDLRLWRDTPNDTLANLDIKAILPQLWAVRELYWHAWNSVLFRDPLEIKWQRNEFDGQVVSPAPGRPVPDLPREGFLATYYYGEGDKRISPRGIPWTVGIRRTEVRDCDAEGRYRFEGMTRQSLDLQKLAVQVYEVTPGTGAITACTDLGKQAGDIKSVVIITEVIPSVRSLVFACTEFSLVGLYDPRFLQDLGEVTLLDARRNAEPQRYNVLIAQRMMTAFVESDLSAYLVFRYGRVGNRLLLLNVADIASMKPSQWRGKDVNQLAKGFRVEQLRDLGALALVTARDFWRTDEIRLRNYRAAGVSSKLLDDLHAQAAEQIATAERLSKGKTGAGAVREAAGAWANEARVYQATQDMAGDVIHAAIFLLLLCVPFSFAMERLLIGSPSIYKQIAYTIGMFGVMTAALWSFHPAFKISTSPLIIILAFTIIFMSLVVISVVYGKFDTELKRLRSGRGSAASTSFARASVLMSAVLLGIANMRKRRFRTALTSATVVLITFAVLAFTSATHYLDTTTLPTGVATPYPGMMLRQRGFRPMPEVAIENVRAALGDRPMVERWWNIDASDAKNQIHVVSLPGAGATPVVGAVAPRIFSAQAVLGLTPGESRLARDGQIAEIANVIGPDKFQRLENGEQRIIYLSDPIAAELKVHEGDTVRMGGLDLEVAGVFKANDFDRRVTTLSGEPLAPLKYSSGALDSSGKQLSDNGAEALGLDNDTTAGELNGAYEHLSSSQFVIVPASVSRMLPNSSLRSIGLRLPDEPAVKTVSDLLARRFAIALFAGFNDGVKLVAANDHLGGVSGASQVAIPLAIAGLIIFNTMMGSIAERRREIHVYTSLGLAPMHVGALFVAEALTYGLIGAVFGYVIGQGAGTLMLKLGWLGNVTLNYSGTSAMLTLSLILLIVLLSALVPARLASKIAAPSIDRTWKVPLPNAGEITAHLPFTINRTAADGALAYLAEFFDAHQEGSIGKFSSGKVEAFNFTDGVGGSSRGLKTVIWLTPFDLGVRQHLLLMIHPGQYEDIYEVQVILQRLSGDDGSWYRMNRSFLTELRKQFLQWRSLTPQRMLDYVEESRKLFQNPSTQVVRTAPGEGVRLA